MILVAIVTTFIVLGISITFAFYLVPTLQANRLLSLFVPFKAIVDPTFTSPRVNVGAQAAKTVVWLNAAVYSAIGLLVGIAVIRLRKARI